MTPNTQGASWDAQRVINEEFHHKSAEQIAEIINASLSKERAEGERKGRLAGMHDTDEEWRMAIELSGDVSIDGATGEKKYGFKITNHALLKELIEPKKRTLPADSTEGKCCNYPCLGHRGEKCVDMDCTCPKNNNH